MKKFEDYSSSNRTFMELKFAGGYQQLGSSLCSNRTFMELKYECC